MALSVKPVTLDFSSGHDLTVCGFKPHIGLCADRVEPASDSLSVSLPTRTLCLKIKLQQKSFFSSS